MIRGQHELLTTAAQKLYGVNFGGVISEDLGGVNGGQLFLLLNLLESDLVFNLTGSRFFTPTPPIGQRNFTRDFDFFVLIDTYTAKHDYEITLHRLRMSMTERILSFSDYTVSETTHVTQQMLWNQGVSRVRRFTHPHFTDVQFDIQEMNEPSVYIKKQRLQKDNTFRQRMRDLYSGKELGYLTLPKAMKEPTEEVRVRNKILRTGMWMGALAQDL